MRLDVWDKCGVDEIIDATRTFQQSMNDLFEALMEVFQKAIKAIDKILNALKLRFHKNKSKKIHPFLFNRFYLPNKYLTWFARVFPKLYLNR